MRLNFSAPKAIAFFFALCTISTTLFSCQKTAFQDLDGQALRATSSASTGCAGYQISTSAIYNAGTDQTTFTWTIVNPSPGSGSNGTIKHLSQWAMPLCDRAAANMVSMSNSGGVQVAVNYGDQSSPIPCAAGTTLRFDYGTDNVNNTAVYTLVLSGEFITDNAATGYFKAGNDCCTRTFEGVSCVVPTTACSYSQGYWFNAGANQHTWPASISFGQHTYTEATARAIRAAMQGGHGDVRQAFLQSAAIQLSFVGKTIPSELAGAMGVIDSFLGGLTITPSSIPSVSDAGANAAAAFIKNWICNNHCGDTTTPDCE